MTENASAKIYGIVDETQIYRTIKEGSAQSKYTVAILLLTDDETKLKSWNDLANFAGDRTE